MRKRGRFGYLLCAPITFALAVLIGAAGFGSVLAQTPGTAGPVSLGDLFKPASPDLRAGAEEKVREAGGQTINPGGCAEKAKFKVRVKRSNDPILDEALAQARRDVLKAVLADSPLSSRFEFSYELASRDDVQVDYDRMQDKEPPKLHTSSVPPKGTKVKPNDRITVTMTARDDSTTWQTGIQRIQLIAQNPSDELVGAQDYPPVIRANCEGRPEPRTLVLAYTVPSNPPPIVRLRAITEDFVNLSDFDIGEFPTKGDWYGTLEFSTEGVTAGVRLTIKDRMDIVLEYDGKGNLTGSLVGHRSFSSLGDPACGWTTTIPNKLRGKLVGSYTPGAEVMSLQLVEPVVAPATRKDCPGGGYIYSGDSVHEWPPFIRVLQSPRAANDGTFRSSVEDTTGGSYTNRISLTLRPVQN